MAGPAPKTEYSLKFEDFSGGLNIRDMEYDLETNESPDIHDGTEKRLNQGWIDFADIVWIF